MAIRAPDGANKEKAAGGSWQQGNQFPGGTNSVGAVSTMCEHDSLRQLRIRENCICFGVLPVFLSNSCFLPMREAGHA